MRALLALLVFATLSDWTIAIRVKGTVEISPDGLSWSGLIRNHILADQQYTRTLAGSLGQVRSADGSLVTLGPETRVRLAGGRVSLEQGAMRLEGCVKLSTRLGTLESVDPTFEGYLADRGAQGMMCEVFEGWIRIRGVRDVDGGERATWSGDAITVVDGNPGEIPAELRPRDDD